MKSHINRLTDFRNVQFEKQIALSCPEEVIAAELRRITRKGRRSVPAESVENGDIVYLRLESTEAKYNKAMLPLTVGSGLFDPVIEAALIGKKAGDTFEADVGCKVRVTVLKAMRTVYPEPDDGMVKEFARENDEYGSVTTVAEFIEAVKKRYREDARVNAIGDAMQTVFNGVLTTSDWEFDDEEVAALVDRTVNDTREAARSELGKELEELSEDEFLKNIGVRSLEDLRHSAKVSAEQWIAMLLWWSHETGNEASLDDLGSVSFGFVEEYIKENIIFTEE